MTWFTIIYWAIVLLAIVIVRGRARRNSPERQAARHEQQRRRNAAIRRSAKSVEFLTDEDIEWLDTELRGNNRAVYNSLCDAGIFAQHVHDKARALQERKDNDRIEPRMRDIMSRVLAVIIEEDE